MKKLLMALMMAVAMFCTNNIAFAESNYIADVESASSNISAIFKVCPGMSYDNVIDSFSGASEWSKYESSLPQGRNGEDYANIRFYKGAASDTVTERVDIWFCNNIATSVNCAFYTDDEAVANEIYDIILSNVQQQITCNVYDNSRLRHASAKVNDDERLRIAINERDNPYRANAGSDNTSSNPDAINKGKCLEVIFEDWVKGDIRPHNAII